MQSGAATVEEYLASLPEDRRGIVSKVRDAINARLPDGYEEGMQYGMIGWYVPHSIFPSGYHCDPKQPLPFAGLASQKNHIGVYLFCLYVNEEHLAWFTDAYAQTGKKLDMGKSCMRFKKLEDFALEVVVESIARVPVDEFVAHYISHYPPKEKKTKKPK
jgi:hypothetical protein